MHLARVRVRWSRPLSGIPAVVAAAVLAALTLSATAQAASYKPYSLVICALGTSESCAPNPTSPADRPSAVPAGQTGVSMSATILNENKAGSGINVGSANLTPPAGFTVRTTSISGVAPFACPSTCSATVVGNVVLLRGMAVPPGSAVTVTMTVDTPQSLAACTMAARCTWSPAAKQSNDFSGPPGNADTLDPATSSTSTVLAQLQFPPSGQPGSVRLGEAITNSDYNPPPSAGTGRPVLVDIADADGTPVTSYNGVVSLTLNTPNNPLTNPNPATLGGTASRNAAGGVASFSDLTVSEPGNGYTLTAAANDVPPTTTSNTFNAQQAAAVCPDGASCAAEATSSKDWQATDGGVDVTVKSSTGKKSELVESIDFGNWTAATRTLECGGASLHFAYQAFTVDRPLTATVTTTDVGLTKNNFNASVSGQEVCLAQSSPFMALNLSTNPPSLTPAAPVTLPDGTPGYAGLEPDCGTKSNQVPPTGPGAGPCVTGRSGKLGGSGGGTLTISDSSPTDRYIN